MLSRAAWEEVGKDLILVLFTEYFAMTVIFHIVIAVWLAIWTRKKFVGLYPGASSLSKPITIVFGIWCFAGLMMVNDLFTRQVPAIQAERAKEAADQAETRRKLDEARPEFMEERLRGWLEKINYPTQHLEPAANEGFRFKVVGDCDCTVFQLKSTDSVTISTELTLTEDYANKLKKLSLEKHMDLLNKVELNLLQLGIQHRLNSNSSAGVFQVRLTHEFPLDLSTTRTHFVSEFYKFKRGKRILGLETEVFFRGSQ